MCVLQLNIKKKSSWMKNFTFWVCRFHKVAFNIAPISLFYNVFVHILAQWCKVYMMHTSPQIGYDGWGARELDTNFSNLNWVEIQVFHFWGLIQMESHIGIVIVVIYVLHYKYKKTIIVEYKNRKDETN